MAAETLDYVVTQTAVTVQLADGRSEPYPAGAVIRSEDLAPHLRERIVSGDPYTAPLFKTATKKEYEGQPDETAGDHVTRQVEEAEQVARARADIPLEERLGPQIDRSGSDVERTKPISGADVETDRKFAANANGADTSENLSDERADAEDISESGPPVVSIAPRVGDIGESDAGTVGAEAGAPKRRSRKKKKTAAPAPAIETGEDAAGSTPLEEEA